MLPAFAPLRDLTVISIIIRLFAAVLCGGVIGLEREYKCRPSGLRTHTLICLGAAMTTLTSQYLWEYRHMYTDVARLGAQVIAGIGFIGAGTIIVTRRKRVKGLTTAAGLWTAAISGLACGIGYLEAALYTTALVLAAELVFSRIEYRFKTKAQDVTLYVEYANTTPVDLFLRCFGSFGIRVSDLQVTRFSEEEDEKRVCAIFSLRLNKKADYEKLIGELSALKGVAAVEKI